MDICFLNFISRSGSTLLSSRLHKNPEVFVTIEADLPRDIIRGKTNTTEELLRILRKISKGNKFRKNWDLSVDEMYNKIDLPADNIEILKQILLLHYKKQINAQKRNAKVLVFKGFRPSIFEFNKYISAFPGFKMLYLYRDPRAIYNSQSKNYITAKSKVYNWLFSLPFTASPYEFAEEWKNHTSQMKRMNEENNFQSVRYEDFIRSSQEVLDSVYNFLGVANIHSKETATKSYKDKIPADQKALHKYVGKDLNENRITAWKCELDINSIKVIENIAGSEMKSCGYEFYAADKPPVSFYFWMKVTLKQIILNYRYKLKNLYTTILRKSGFS